MTGFDVQKNHHQFTEKNFKISNENCYVNSS